MAIVKDNVTTKYLITHVVLWFSTVYINTSINHESITIFKHVGMCDVVIHNNNTVYAADKLNYNQNQHQINKQINVN